MHYTTAHTDGPPAAQFSLESLVGMIHRHRGLAIIAALITGAAMVIGFWFMTPLYQAEATLVVDRAARALRDDDGTKQDDYSFLNTQRDLLLSDSVLSRALVANGALVRKPYSQASDPTAVLRQRLSMIVNKDSWMITVSLRDENPVNARNLLALVLHSYTHHEIDLRQNRASGELEFLKHQVDTERALLTTARAREQDFRASHGLLTADPDRSPVASQLDSYSAKQVELVRDLDAERVVIAQLAASDAIPDSENRTRALLEIAEIKQDAAVSQHREKLAALQDTAVQLGQKYKAKHPRMMEIANQIAAEQGQLAQAIVIARSALENHERALAQQNVDMSNEIKKLQAGLTDYRGDLMAMEALSEERGTHERVFTNLLTKLRQAEIDNRAIPSQLMAIDAPHTSSQPVNIHWPLFLLATAITAGIVAVLATLIADVTDRHIADADTVRGMAGLEILGSIAHVAGLQPLGKRRDPHQVLGGSPANRDLDECFNALRISLHLGEEIDSARVLMVASSSSGDGRSTVTARLGQNLAANGLRVLLIDGDMRRRALDRHVGEQSDMGLSEWLNGDARVKPMPTSYPRLDIITGGNPSEPEQLQARRLRMLIDDMRPYYECIILDSPPIKDSSDALVAATVVDNILLVVRGRHTTRDHLAFALDRLGWLRQKLLGIVFNDDESDRAGQRPADAPLHAPSRTSAPSITRSQPNPAVPPSHDGVRAAV